MIPVKQIEKINYSDDELIQLYKKSANQEYLASVYLRYNHLVYGTCMKYLKDPETAKDAVMNIYHELLIKIKAHEVENFRSWLYVFTKNHCLMKLRSDKKMITVEFTSALVQSEDFSHLDTMLEKENDFKKLENCIASLPEDQKHSIRYFYMDNKCYNEIVELTGFEWGKVRSLIQNGRRNLKICMEKNA